MERAHHCWVIESAMICRNHRLPRRPYTITVPPLNRLGAVWDVVGIDDGVVSGW